MCGLIPVKAGVRCVAVFYIALGIMALLATVLGPFLQRSFTDNYSLFAALYIGTGMCAIHGVRSSRPGFLLPLMILCIIELSMACVALLMDPILLLSPQYVFGEMKESEVFTVRLVATGLGVLLAIVIALKAWFTFAIYRCFQQIRNENYIHNLQIHDFYVKTI
uniref:Uncharacterized protein n=1 Tax=Steinernema glaseri TaxID=37863 RepID=A0A1I8AAH8_9BILA